VDTHHPTTRSPRAALLLGLLSFGISAATTAQAGNQLFEGSWSVKSQGNECSLADPSPGPHCGNGWSESEFYSAFGLPQGIQCNPNQPRCPFESTPTDGSGMFDALGGSRYMALFCAPWENWRGYGTTARPAKGDTVNTTGKNRRKIPPLYRNPQFFTPGGEPDTAFCTATSTGATPGGKGLVQAGQPIAGKWGAVTTGTPGIGGFTFAAAPAGAAGVRTTGQAGDLPAFFPYVYSYTYATLRNDVGVFGPGKGPGSFNLVYQRGTKSVASINVKQGSAKFGGTMRMLGALTTKVCYYRNGGCSLVKMNWRYDAVGVAAYTYEGIVTRGYVATYVGKAYNTMNPASSSTTHVVGARFPWTTGSVTVTATGPYPHRTVHYAHGYDNRNTTTPSGKGTIQLVTPVLTRWLHPRLNFETGGIAILRIKFVPEPQTWLMLVAGASLLGVGARMRGR
jgi:hypothetical protein